VELLRDVFVFAYERSAAQYRVVRESLGQPDPIRLRYRDQITDAVARVVRSGAAPSSALFGNQANDLGVPSEDRDAFSDAALHVLLSLNEGSAARHGLTPSEFAEWRTKFASK
jgi:hypothetical protein